VTPPGERLRMAISHENESRVSASASVLEIDMAVPGHPVEAFVQLVRCQIPAFPDCAPHIDWRDSRVLSFPLHRAGRVPDCEDRPNPGRIGPSANGFGPGFGEMLPGRRAGIRRNAHLPSMARPGGCPPGIRRRPPGGLPGGLDHFLYAIHRGCRGGVPVVLPACARMARRPCPCSGAGDPPVPPKRGLSGGPRG